MGFGIQGSRRFRNGIYVLTVSLFLNYRDELREQHALSEEIANAITNAPIGEPIDEDDLENELEGMEQEQIDERMLKTGTVPVADQLNKLPAAANGESKFPADILLSIYIALTNASPS
jgi:hypothetical protein